MAGGRSVTSLASARASRAEKGPSRVDFKGVVPYSAAATTARLVEALGSNTVADLLGVARDRPGRWARGAGNPDPANRAALAELDALVARLLAAFTPEQAGLWLFGDNAALGARPVDVFRVRGALPVMEAIQAHEQGAVH
ncbi:MAG: hypothetical protein QOJ92_2981 [Frankiales bacterium]|jgi:hypothetical protein|nr:hypothetical protein [Frankiales bacterium]MDX6275771.1 hypothetical protein [Frankiales bacterium]